MKGSKQVMSMPETAATNCFFLIFLVTGDGQVPKGYLPSPSAHQAFTNDIEQSLERL
jgi:hypothetical protein